MNAGVTVPETGAAKMTRQQIRAELAHYLAQQPAAKQTFHKWMKVAEMGGLAVIAAWFAVAMYVSINHTMVPETTIAAAWIAFPVSFVPVIILGGLHTVVLRASVSSLLPGKPGRFVTGSKAVRFGWGAVAMALAAGLFWGALAWGVWSFDLALIGVYTRIIGTALGTVIAGSIAFGLLAGLYKQFIRPR